MSCRRTSPDGVRNSSVIGLTSSCLGTLRPPRNGAVIPCIVAIVAASSKASSGGCPSARPSPYIPPPIPVDSASVRLIGFAARPGNNCRTAGGAASNTPNAAASCPAWIPLLAKSSRDKNGFPVAREAPRTAPFPIFRAIRPTSVAAINSSPGIGVAKAPITGGSPPTKEPLNCATGCSSAAEGEISPLA